MKNLQTKTDNSYLDGKIALRLQNLPLKKEIRILDAFGGKGVIWGKIQKIRPDINIIVISLEIKKGKNKKAIEGDNIKILPSIDLSSFDIIDLDAYGSPYKQLKAILKNNTFKEAIIFTTDIQTMQGKLPDELLLKTGVTKQMIKKIPTMFSKLADQAMQNYLDEIGVKTYLEYRPETRKKYRAFNLKRT